MCKPSNPKPMPQTPSSILLSESFSTPGPLPPGARYLATQDSPYPPSLLKSFQLGSPNSANLILPRLPPERDNEAHSHASSSCPLCLLTDPDAPMCGPTWHRGPPAAGEV